MAKKNGTPETEPQPVEPVEEIGLGDPGDAEMVLPDEAAPPMVEEAPGETYQTPTLSDKELVQIEEQARVAVEKEFKAALRKQVLEEAKAKHRQKLSVSPNENLNGALSDLVRITIVVPEFSNDPAIRLDGKVYLHGSTYTVQRHIGNQLRETMQWQRRHQNEIDGKKRNRQLPSGAFVDVVTGRVTTGSVISGANL